jgi:hypothetical protein
MKYKILISLVIVIIIFLYFGSVIKGNSLLSELLHKQDIHLDEMERLNVPKESFTSIETLPRQKVINGIYDTIQTKMNLAAEAQNEAKAIASDENQAIKDDNTAIIQKIDSVLTGDGNSYSIGPFANATMQQDIVRDKLNDISGDLAALYKEINISHNLGPNALGFLSQGKAFDSAKELEEAGGGLSGLAGQRANETDFMGNLI